MKTNIFKNYNKYLICWGSPVLGQDWSTAMLIRDGKRRGNIKLSEELVDDMDEYFIEWKYSKPKNEYEKEKQVVAL